MNERLPQPVQHILEQYVASIEQELPGFVRAFYIVGSIALGGFNEKFSDIDFVAVTNRKAGAEHLAILGSLHAKNEKDHPRWKLSGSYVQEEVLGKTKNEVSPCPYYHDGRLHPEGYFEINQVTWWILKYHGIAIFGSEPRDLPLEVDWEVLIADMKQNMNTYWASWTYRVDGFLVMLADWGIQWTVLGVLRQYYTFQEKSIPTKEGAGEYGLARLPARWHPLIREAISIRAGKKQPHYRLRVYRMMETVKFLKYVIQVSNEGMGT